MNELPAIGESVDRLIVRYPAILPDLAAFRFRTYRTKPSMIDESVRLTGAQSTTRQKQSWLGIQEKLFPMDRLEEAVNLALRHEAADETETHLSQGDVRHGVFRDLLPPGRPADLVLAMSSRCMANDGSERFLPMLDFQCQPDAYFLAALQFGLKKIAPGGGALVDSGRSFHFYGFRDMTKSQWREFMYRALLLAPLTDARYVAHRLIDGYAALRITSSPLKPTIPTIAAYVED